MAENNDHVSCEDTANVILVDKNYNLVQKGQKFVERSKKNRSHIQTILERSRMSKVKNPLLEPEPYIDEKVETHRKMTLISRIKRDGIEMVRRNCFKRDLEFLDKIEKPDDVIYLNNLFKELNKSLRPRHT